MTLYEIRRDGRVWVRSPIPNCGYSDRELRSLRAHGFRLHAVNGIPSASQIKDLGRQSKLERKEKKV